MVDLRRIAAGRDRAMDRLSMEVENAPLLGALDWSHRLRWLGLTLTERREDWGRPLLSSWSSSLPKSGDPLRGPSALALGLVALALADQDPEEGSAYLAGPPTKSLDAVVEETLEAAAQESFSIKDEALLRLALLAESDGDTTAALKWANALLNTNPNGPHASTAHAVRARSLYGTGQYPQAVAEARLGITDDATAELRWILARALAASGRTGEAVRELEALVLAKPTDPLAIDALQMRRELAMAPAHIPLDTSTEILLLTALLANADAGADNELQRIQNRPDVSAQTKDNVSIALARYLYRKKAYADLLPRVQALATSSNASVRSEAGLIEARVYRNTTRLPQMEKTYRSLMKRGGDTAATAAWELAKEWESQARWNDAAKTYTELITRFPQSERKRDATFRRGFSRLMQGKKSNALGDFRSALRLSRTPGEKEQAAFWTARTLWTTGHRKDAIALARRAARMSEPADAYGVLIRERFAVPEYPRDPSEDVNFFPATRRTQAFTATADTYDRGLARLQLGLQKGAAKEWRAAVRNRSSQQELVTFAVAASAFSLYPEATDWAKQALETTAPGDPHRIALRRLAYPAAHAGHVVTEATKYEIDPAWVWALIRQESYYNPKAVSKKGALGLMQVMPATLAEMTAERGLAPLPPDALFRPNTNIAFGTRYFAERLDEFDRKLPPTLASYNAGEGKSLEWIERAKGDGGEVFMECIGYPETYDYVRRILLNVWLYHRFYAEESAIG